MTYNFGGLQRRSARLDFRSQIVVSGTGSDGMPFRAEAETVQVSLHGARIRSNILLHVGMELRVIVPCRGQSRMARVVWTRLTPDREFGIELCAPGAFWGINFQAQKQRYMPARGGVSLMPGITTAGHSEPQAATPVRESSDAAGMAPTQTAQPAAVPQASVEASRNNSAGGSLRVLVTGISILRIPFQEAAVLESAGSNEATLCITAMVDRGSRLRLIVPGYNRVLTVRVKGISGGRPGEKWKVRVELPDRKNEV